MRLRIVFLFLILSLTLFEACNNTDNVDQQGCVGLGSISTLPPASIAEVSAFIDASGSMKGFMTPNQGTDFQSLVADIFGRISRDMSSARCYVLSQKTSPIRMLTMDEARKAIAYGNFEYGNSSTLPVMFDTCINHVSDNSVSLLITDGIYTPSANQARMKYQETTDIANALSIAAKKDMVAECLAFRSKFADSSSPFYIFIIGKPQNVTAVKNKIQTSLATVSSQITYNDFQEAGFGFPVQSPFYTIIPYAENTGAGEPSPCPDNDNRYLVMSNLDVGANAKFWIGVDLSFCPKYIDRNSYLASRLITDNKHITASIGQILPASAFSTRITDPTDKALAAKCTHFVQIQVNSMDDNIGTISLSLKKDRPAWIAEYNHNDAGNAEKLRDKTYGLAYIAAGLEDAYSAKEPGFFFKDIKISITKKQ